MTEGTNGERRGREVPANDAVRSKVVVAAIAVAVAGVAVVVVRGDDGRDATREDGAAPSASALEAARVPPPTSPGGVAGVVSLIGAATPSAAVVASGAGGDARRAGRRDAGAPPARGGTGAGSAAANARTPSAPDAGVPAGLDGGAHKAEARGAAAEAARRAFARERAAPDDEGDLVRVNRFVASGGALMEGRVVDADGGRALGSTVIEARLGGRYVETLADGSGGFRLAGMQPGSRVVVWVGGKRDGYIAERIDATMPAEGQVADMGPIRLLHGDELGPRLDGWVGLFVTRRGGHVQVSAVSPWLPADQAGVEVGDHLLSIDGRDVTGLGPRAVTFLLRGPVDVPALVVFQPVDAPRRKLALTRVLR